MKSRIRILGSLILLLMMNELINYSYVTEAIDFCLLCCNLCVESDASGTWHIRKTGKILRWLKCHLMWLNAMISVLNRLIFGISRE